MCLLVAEFMVTDTMTRLNHFLSNLCCAGSILVVEKVLLELVPIGGKQQSCVLYSSNSDVVTWGGG